MLDLAPKAAKYLPQDAYHGSVNVLFATADAKHPQAYCLYYVAHPDGTLYVDLTGLERIGFANFNLPAGLHELLVYEALNNFGARESSPNNYCVPADSLTSFLERCAQTIDLAGELPTLEEPLAQVQIALAAARFKQLTYDAPKLVELLTQDHHKHQNRKDEVWITIP